MAAGMGRTSGKNPGRYSGLAPGPALRPHRRGRRGRAASPARARCHRCRFSGSDAASPSALLAWRWCSAASSSPCSRRTSASPTWRSPVVASGTPGCFSAVSSACSYSRRALRGAAAGLPHVGQDDGRPELVGQVPGRAQTGHRLGERVHRDLEVAVRPGGQPEEPGATTSGEVVLGPRQLERAAGVLGGAGRVPAGLGDRGTVDRDPARAPSRSASSPPVVARPRGGIAARGARSASTSRASTPSRSPSTSRIHALAVPSTGRRRTTSSGSACSHSTIVRLRRRRWASGSAASIRSAAVSASPPAVACPMASSSRSWSAYQRLAARCRPGPGPGPRRRAGRGGRRRTGGGTGTTPAGRRGGRRTGCTRSRSSSLLARRSVPVSASHSGPVIRSSTEVSSRNRRTSSGWRPSTSSTR